MSSHLKFKKSYEEAATDPDGCRGTGQCDKSAGCFIAHCWAGGVEQVVNAPDEAGTFSWVGMAYLSPT